MKWTITSVCGIYIIVCRETDNKHNIINELQNSLENAKYYGEKNRMPWIWDGKEYGRFDLV